MQEKGEQNTQDAEQGALSCFPSPHFMSETQQENTPAPSAFQLLLSFLSPFQEVMIVLIIEKVHKILRELILNTTLTYFNVYGKGNHL